MFKVMGRSPSLLLAWVLCPWRVVAPAQGNKKGKEMKSSQSSAFGGSESLDHGPQARVVAKTDLILTAVHK